jgi:acetyl-CoA carboxylase biotin carboxylase subunit
VERARHVEVQVLGDGRDAVHLWERECSLQRRRQKVWEEARSGIPDEARQRLCEGAVALARSVGYRGAGTLEYLFDEASGEVFFIEMNTRIQVEHPVTELVTGLDLVALMIRVAGGEPLPVRQEDVRAEGHAIEVRINAEDPSRNFMPFPGRVASLRIPEGARFDHFLYEGYAIPPFYDSLLGKLVVHAGTRDAAIDALGAALDGLEIGGVRTTVPLHRALCEDEDVRAGRVHTQWLEPWLAAGGLERNAA